MKNKLVLTLFLIAFALNAQEQNYSFSLEQAISHENSLLRLKIYSSNLVKDFLLEKKDELLNLEKRHPQYFFLLSQLTVFHSPVHQ